MSRFKLHSRVCVCLSTRVCEFLFSLHTENNVASYYTTFLSRQDAGPFTLCNYRGKQFQQQEHWVFTLNYSTETGVLTLHDSLCQEVWPTALPVSKRGLTWDVCARSVWSCTVIVQGSRSLYCPQGANCSAAGRNKTVNNNHRVTTTYNSEHNNKNNNRLINTCLEDLWQQWQKTTVICLSCILAGCICGLTEATQSHQPRGGSGQWGVRGIHL